MIVRVLVGVGAIMLMLSSPRWGWFTNRWYPTGWSLGWLGLAGGILACVGVTLHLHYRDSPYGGNDRIDGSDR